MEQCAWWLAVGEGHKQGLQAMRRLIILALIVACILPGCRKLSEAEIAKREGKRASVDTNENVVSEETTIWTINTPYGTYQGHKMEFDSYHVRFVDANGMIVIVNGQWQVTTQGK
jgi:hypothetical protein